MSGALENFKDLLNNSSLNEKHLMLEVLLNEIKAANESVAITNRVEISPSIDSLVSSSKNIINDKKFLLDLHKELDSLDLHSPKSRKPKSLWLSVGGNCVYEGKNYAPNDLKDYPFLSKLLVLVNEHHLVNAKLDCIHILCYSDSKHTLRLHADNEP